MAHRRCAVDRRDEVTVKNLDDVIIDAYLAGRRGDPIPNGGDFGALQWKMGARVYIAWRRGVAARHEVEELNRQFHMDEPGAQQEFSFEHF